MSIINPNPFNNIKPTGPAFHSYVKKVVSSPVVGDTAEISKAGFDKLALSADIESIVKNIKVLPEVRESLLAQVAEKINAGEYDESSFTTQLADKLIEQM